MTPDDVRIPPPSSYLAGHIVNRQLGGYELVPDNRDPASRTKFRSRLFTLKIENQTNDENNPLCIKLQVLGAESDDPLEEIVAEVDYGEYDLGDGEGPRYHGAWIVVPRGATRLRVWAGASANGLSELPEFEISVVGDIIKVDGGSITARSQEGRRVYSYCGRVRLRNYTDDEYFIWVERKGVWSCTGETLEGTINGEMNEVEPDVTGASRLSLGTSSTKTPDEAPKDPIFEVFEVNQPTVTLGAKGSSKIRSNPFVVSTKSGTVEVINDSGSDLDVWAEGSPDKVPLKDGEPTTITLPYRDGTKTYQSAIHWALDDDPKIIVRHTDLAQDPTRGPSR